MADLRKVEPEFHLMIIDLEAEAARWRWRSMFLLSVLLHAFVGLIMVIHPQLFKRGARMIGIQIEPERQTQTTFLTMPPDLEKPKPRPNTNILSDKNREAQGPSPKVDPNGLRMPYIRGNTPLPEIAGGANAPPPMPPPAPATPPPGPKAQGNHGQESPPAPKDQQEGQLKLMDVPTPSGGGEQSRLQMPYSTPGEAIQQSLRSAARGRASGSIPGPGDSLSQLNNVDPNFSTQGPIILSDTQGVDFGPYLARVVYNVRKNWYSMIPESARLGQKGRVSLVFEILKDGSVPEIRLVASSGAEPLDTAAIASIRASNPFPPLPQEFTGKHLVLQFNYFYNMGYGY
ncbi:MAG TPA: TonB family protein [Terriglobia bacterium]|nr:TonB family protein [Terriglobia bacterium]